MAAFKNRTPFLICLKQNVLYAKIHTTGENMLSTNTEIQTITGAQIVVETLKKLGVEAVFGYPGGIVLGVYDELYKQNDIKHYLVRHEQSAVHAAEGYARVSGKCGVVLVTSGPGAANTVSGIANAYLDGYPVVVLTGQVFASLIGKDAFQEVDIIDITKSCTKANYQVTDVKNLEKTLVEAFHTALSGKQGPVVVDLAKNIFTDTAEFNPSVCYQIDKPKYLNIDIKAVLNEICSAERPVVVAGGGVVLSDAHKELIELVKLLGVPVVNTMMGLGTYPQDDENYLGMIGIFGQNSANRVLRESDLIFSIGARFNDRITCCFPNKELERKFIQLDINEKEISRVIPSYMHLVGDAKSILTDMISVIKHENLKPLFTDWLNIAGSFKNSNSKPEKISNMLHSYEVIQHIYEYTKDKNPIVSTEVGQHQLWTAKNFKFSQPRKFLTSGGSGTMGFGLPAAIGACAADASQPVICISGDGSLQMNFHELATCVDYKLPVKIFVLNNGYLGMVRQLQQKFCGGRFSETKISNPDFVKLAESYGICAIRVHTEAEIIPALEKAFAIDGPVLVDFIIEPMEVV